jgi:hypothetical protein
MDFYGNNCHPDLISPAIDEGIKEEDNGRDAR